MISPARIIRNFCRHCKSRAVKNPNQHYGLLDKPYVFPRNESDSNFVVYPSESEYGKVKNFRHGDLVKDSVKVSPKLEVEGLFDWVYYSDKLIELKVVDGGHFPIGKPVDWL